MGTLPALAHLGQTLTGGERLPLGSPWRELGTLPRFEIMATATVSISPVEALSYLAPRSRYAAIKLTAAAKALGMESFRLDDDGHYGWTVWADKGGPIAFPGLAEVAVWLRLKLTPAAPAALTPTLPVLNSRTVFPEHKSLEALYKITRNNILSVNPKTEKSLKNGDPQTYILHLAPHNLSGVNVCPGAGNCKKICLHSAGNPVYMQAKQAARIRRTLAYAHNPEAFLRLVVCSILDKVNKANGEPIAVRLNGTSDVAWENVDFNVSPEFATFCRVKYGVQLLVGRQNIFELFNSLNANCRFYDYTKIRRDWALCAYLSYHLTFSFDGWDNLANLKLCREAIANGVNIAAAFNIKRGKSLPSVLESGRLAGFNLPIFDGDLTDYRPADPGGVIVGLRYKLPVGSPMGPIEKDLFKRAFCIS